MAQPGEKRAWWEGCSRKWGIHAGLVCLSLVVDPALEISVVDKKGIDLGMSLLPLCHR